VEGRGVTELLTERAQQKEQQEEVYLSRSRLPPVTHFLQLGLTTSQNNVSSCGTKASTHEPVKDTSCPNHDNVLQNAFDACTILYDRHRCYNMPILQRRKLR
jgi:hypothetical protein